MDAAASTGRALGILLTITVAMGCLPGRAPAADRVTIGLNGVVGAEHGGFFQAVADGHYRRYGLEVLFREPDARQDNVHALMDGALDFNIAGSMVAQVEETIAGLPTVSVAAIFQKELVVLLARPGLRSPGQIAGRTLFLSQDGRWSLLPWLMRAYGASAAQVRPADGTFRAFAAEPDSIQEGFSTSAPQAIEVAAGFRPNVVTLGEAAYRPYSGLIQARRATVEERAELVQRVVDATAAGWYSYLYGDPSPAHDLIRRHRPDLGAAELLRVRHVMNVQGLVDSGLAEKAGIGAMEGGRWADLVKLGQRRGYYAFHGAFGAADALSRMYTLDFVNQRAGMEIKQRLLAD
jgi:NitT/TauT family transport system substrate-binding protein